MNNIAPSIITVNELLTIDNLSIPEYQRPYKWSEYNVNQLIDDILAYCRMSKSAYRLGTVVGHYDNSTKELNIVDGQQRTLTLALIACFIYNNHKDKLQRIIQRGDNIEKYYPKLVGKLKFDNHITKYNILQNYRVIERREADFDDDFIHFFFNKCQLVKVVLYDISEAFQFFDSQNARGRDLAPHDLLKAFHLREMECESTESQIRSVVSSWESIDTNTLSKLFSQYLYRIKNWSKDYQARYFTKNDVSVFKGLSPNLTSVYPFAKLNQVAHYYVESYNSSLHRNIHGNEMVYPFQIDQPVINGRRFFEMVVYYNDLICKIKELRTNNSTLQLLYDYIGCNRTGDKYVRNMFYCALLYYVDKFGYEQIDRAIDKLFIWAYTLRLKLKNVRSDSIDNYALHKAGHHSSIALFKIIRDAIDPNEIINIRLEVLASSTQKKDNKLEDKFELLKYYVSGK